MATLTLDRPGQLNAFDLTMARELERFFLTDARSDAVRAVVVTGAGRAFCAGMDLSRDGQRVRARRVAWRRRRRSSGPTTTSRRTRTGCATPAAG